MKKKSTNPKKTYEDNKEKGIFLILKVYPYHSLFREEKQSIQSHLYSLNPACPIV
jgi:hypothetical protein